MKSSLKSNVIILGGLLAALFIVAFVIWFSLFPQQGNKLSPASVKAHNALQLGDRLIDHQMGSTDASPTDQQSLNKVFPQLEQLAAPINDADLQAMLELQQEANQLIEEMDQLLLESDLQEPEITQVEQSEIYPHPEFQKGLKQEEALEERLNSLP